MNIIRTWTSRERPIDIIRTWTFRVAMLVVALAAIGAWEVYKATVRPVGQAQANYLTFDHLACYSITGQSANQFKTVTDQFFPSGVRVDVSGPERLCVPAAKST